MLSISSNVRLNIYTLHGSICHRPCAMERYSITKNLLNKVVRQVAVGTTIGEERQNVQLLVVIILLGFLTPYYVDVVPRQLENVDAYWDLSSFLPPIYTKQFQKMFEQGVVLGLDNLSNLPIQLNNLGQNIVERYELDQNSEQLRRQLWTTQLDIHCYIYYLLIIPKDISI